MSNDLKPELSKKNQYYIDRHRYYELKHFCLQYRNWKSAVSRMDGYSNVHAYIVAKTVDGRIRDSTETTVEAREIYANHIALVENAAKETDSYFGGYILKAVTNGWTYEYLRTVCQIPCCRGTYYELYRRFFWLLDKARK